MTSPSMQETAPFFPDIRIHTSERLIKVDTKVKFTFNGVVFSRYCSQWYNFFNDYHRQRSNIEEINQIILQSLVEVAERTIYEGIPCPYDKVIGLDKHTMVVSQRELECKTYINC